VRYIPLEPDGYEWEAPEAGINEQAQQTLGGFAQARINSTSGAKANGFLKFAQGHGLKQQAHWSRKVDTECPSAKSRVRGAAAKGSERANRSWRVWEATIVPWRFALRGARGAAKAQAHRTDRAYCCWSQPKAQDCRPAHFLRHQEYSSNSTRLNDRLMNDSR
jgi:hypothetical protein